MRCKTAVVASDRSCHAEVLGEYAVLADPDDLNEVVDKIYKVISNDSVRERISTEGYRFVQKYSWDRAAEETMKVILQIGA